MDDEAETYKLWRIRKTVLQVGENIIERSDGQFEMGHLDVSRSGVSGQSR